MDAENEANILNENCSENINTDKGNMETDASLVENEADVRSNVNVEKIETNSSDIFEETLKVEEDSGEDLNYDDANEKDIDSLEIDEDIKSEEELNKTLEKSIIEKKNSKRSARDSDWLSDDEAEFAGFAEHNMDSGNQQHKKPKLEHDPEAIEETLPSELIATDAKDSIVEEHTTPVQQEQIVSNILTTSASPVFVPKKGGRVIALTDPAYRKPFDFGWKREIVLRANPEASKEKGEVYYIAPNGKRLRTRNEIHLNLPRDSELTLANFTFSKETIGVSPDLEIIRSAKIGSNSQGRRTTHMEIDTSGLTTGKRIPKPKVPKGVSPPPQNRPTLPIKSHRGTPQIKRGDSKDGKLIDDSGGKTPKSKSEPCTIQCLLAMGTIPQLQCKKCLCLYHHECMGLENHQAIENYICQGCNLELDVPVQKIENPLENIQTNVISPVVQKQQPTHTFTQNNFTQNQSQQSLPPNNPPSNFNQTHTQVPIKQNVVDSLTTWHHHMTNISTNRNVLNSYDTPPQTIASINGRKFIIVPKTNVLSVSPSGDGKHSNNINFGGASKSYLSDEMKNCNSNDLNTQGSSDSNKKRGANVGGGVGASGGNRTPKRTLDQENLSPPSTLGNVRTNNNTINVGGLIKNDTIDRIGNDGIPTEYSTFFTKNFFTNISNGYDILLHIFQYLKVQELLRAGCVSRMWNHTANNPSLWKTVRMKNSQVNDWNGLASTLIKNGTKHLDLRKMLSPKNNSEEQWNNFTRIIGSVKNLESIDLCKCSISVVEKLFETNSNLKILNAVTLKDDALNLINVINLKNLTELRLKSTVGLVIDDLTPLKELKNIKHLSLTSVRELGEHNSNVLGELNSLVSLELGECSDLVSSFVPEVLDKLVLLQRLRLERGQEKCPTFDILHGISKMENLVQLELINFDIRAEFDDYLGKCTNIKKLLLIPTYVSQSATTNQIVLNGVMKLSKSLLNFTWAVTSELVRVTELYVDNYDANKRSKKALSDCIPVLKPVPGILESTQIMSKRVISDVPQVEILPLTSVEKILNTALPHTNVHMIIIAYHATWRQNLVEN